MDVRTLMVLNAMGVCLTTTTRVRQRDLRTACDVRTACDLRTACEPNGSTIRPSPMTATAS
jgi:hypothetical protein